MRMISFSALYMRWRGLMRGTGKPLLFPTILPSAASIEKPIYNVKDGAEAPTGEAG